MPTPKLYFDGCCELRHVLEPWITDLFYDFSTLTIDPDAVYVVGRLQSKEHAALIRSLLEQHRARIIFANPYEGSETLMMHLKMSGLDDLAKNRSLKVITGGEVDPDYDYLLYEFFLPQVLDYKTNIEAITRCQEIFTKKNKPYKVLYLNGRARSHRKWMIEHMDHINLLDQCIWSWLDPSSALSRGFYLRRDKVNLINRHRPIRLLDSRYEVDKYRDNMSFEHTGGYAYHQLFGKDWGAIYLNADAYIDTYFSLVTETVYTYPYSFRTEKIWKPIAMCHPWIAVANRGYYQSIKNMGFRTFSDTIDESFDQIDNNQGRLERTAMIVQDLCQQNLDQWIQEVRPICEHNQALLIELSSRVRKQFPDRFCNWIKQ